MYKKLENQKMDTLQGKEPSSKETCVCSCKSAQPIDGKSEPKVAVASTQGAEHFRVNGG